MSISKTELLSSLGSLGFSTGEEILLSNGRETIVPFLDERGSQVGVVRGEAEPRIINSGYWEDVFAGEPREFTSEELADASEWFT